MNPHWLRAIFLGVAPSIEHVAVLQGLKCRSVVDIGANRGQFALAARRSFPNATIYSFEPLTDPAARFRRVFKDDKAVSLQVIAVGPEEDQMDMHVSGQDDSSSLLPISSLQEEIFPGTGEIKTVGVRVARLDSWPRT